jgi:cytochrome b6-f complex iron-sulfur subunit/menaquinol-cytochrome c reductase iron-sulfur subunit
MNSSAFSCAERSPPSHESGKFGDVVLAVGETWKSTGKLLCEKVYDARPMASDDEKGSPHAPKGAGRRVVVLATLAGACAVAAGAALPAAAFVAAPVRDGSRGKSQWVKTLRFEQLKEGEPKRVAIVADRRDAWVIEKNVELGSVWLVRRGDKVLAFSAVCPHLGCSVNAADKGFACPCHTSAFDPDGKKMSGPSPRDLDALATKIEEGVVAVDFKKFRIGIRERVET